MKAIYIAGPMRNDPNYKTKFDAAESYLCWSKWPLYPEDHPKYCGNCGRAVKWDG